MVPGFLFTQPLNRHKTFTMILFIQHFFLSTKLNYKDKIFYHFHFNPEGKNGPT